MRTRPRPPGPEPPRPRPVAHKSLGLAAMSRRHQREPYDPSVFVDAVPHTSGASGDPTRRCLAVEQPARLDAGVDRHSACTELLQAVAVEVQPEALQVLQELVVAQSRARGPQRPVTTTWRRPTRTRPATWSSGPIGPGTCSKQRQEAIRRAGAQHLRTS